LNAERDFSFLYAVANFLKMHRCCSVKTVETQLCQFWHYAGGAQMKNGLEFTGLGEKCFRYEWGGDTGGWEMELGFTCQFGCTREPS
jgi:hypothetical protein